MSVCVCVYALHEAFPDTCTWAGSAAGVAVLAGPVHSVVVVSLRAWDETTALFPQINEARSAAQAAVLLIANTLTTTGVTLFTHSWGSVSIVTSRWTDGQKLSQTAFN